MAEHYYILRHDKLVLVSVQGIPGTTLEHAVRNFEEYPPFEIIPAVTPLNSPVLKLDVDESGYKSEIFELMMSYPYSRYFTAIYEPHTKGVILCLGFDDVCMKMVDSFVGAWQLRTELPSPHFEKEISDGLWKMVTGVYDEMKKANSGIAKIKKAFDKNNKKLIDFHM